MILILFAGELNDLKMGSLGDDDAEIKPMKTGPNVNILCNQTQVLDSQFSPSSSGTGFSSLILLLFMLNFCAFRMIILKNRKKKHILVELLEEYIEDCDCLVIRENLQFDYD